MKLVLIPLAAAALIAGCSARTPANPEAVAGARGAAGTALATLSAPASEGERLFQANCVMCHADGKLYPGTVQLRQAGQAEPVLAKRTDLSADYVQQVVRNGLNTMPAFTRTHLSDSDLDKITGYLSRRKIK